MKFWGIVGTSLWTLISAFNVFAAGYEKPVMISGRYGGIAGAAVSSVAGPESLAFNPAGLVGTRGAEITNDFSPFLLQKKSPLVPVTGNTTRGAEDLWGKTVFNPAGGLMFGKKVGASLGVGLGVFTVAGGGGNFGETDFGPNFPTLHPEMSGGLVFNDFSLGAGYEIAPGLRLGAAWRVTLVQGAAKVGSNLTPLGIPKLLAIELSGLSDVTYKGFRFGFQYEPNPHSWGLGVDLRTGIAFEASGDSSARSQASGSMTIDPETGGKITEKSGLPWQLDFGGHFNWTPEWRFFCQYSFTNYSSNKTVTYSGDKIAGIDASAFNSTQEWKDLHMFRLATEYQKSSSLALRAGYVLGTQVTPANHATFGSAPPGLTHALAFGAGTHVMQDDALALDGALDFTYQDGTGRDSTAGFLDGRYTVWAVTAHLGATYRF